MRPKSGSKEPDKSPETPGTSANCQGSTAAFDLPGFVYDPVKKRHFRVTNDSPFATAVQPESVKKLKTKEKPIESHVQLRKRPNIPSLRQQFQCGIGPPERFERIAVENLVRNWNGLEGELRHSTMDMEAVESSFSFDRCQFLHLDELGENLIGGWSKGRQMVTAYLGVKVDPTLTTQFNWKFSWTLKGTLTTWNEDVNSVVIDSCAALTTDRRYLLGTIMRTGVTSEMRLTRIYDQTRIKMSSIGGTLVDHNDLWSLAISSTSDLLTLAERNVVHFYSASRLRKIKTKWFSRHAVLAQKFTVDGNLLFMGRRSANIIVTDPLDNHMGKHLIELPQMSTCSIEPHNDPNYVVAKNLNGEVCLMDVRQRKVVLKYSEGHVDAHRKLPMVIDQKQNLIMSMSEKPGGWLIDGWSLRTGELLCQISPPPGTESLGVCPPRMCYSDRWGGIEANSALIVGVGGQLHLYSLK